jgi:hypothetical protein
MLARLREAQGSGQEAMEAMRRLSESGQLTLDDLSTYSMMAARNGDSALAERLADAAARGGESGAEASVAGGIGGWQKRP